MPSFTFVAPGSRSPVTIELHKPLTSVGRSIENDICISDPLLLEEHAHIQFDGEKFTLSALNRKHPFIVNGRSRRSTTLKHEDSIQLGATECTFRMVSETPVDEELPDVIDHVEAYERLFQFSRELMQQFSLTELLELLIDRVIEVTGAQRGFLILLEGNTPKVAVGRNIKRETLADARELYSDSIVAKVAETKEPLIISDALRNENFKHATSVAHLQLSSVMCVPLLEKGKLLGVLYVGNSHITSLFDKTTLKILMVFAAQASLIIQNALLVNELTLDNQKLQQQLEGMQMSGIIGSCEGIQGVLNKVRRVSSTDVSVLITGETGTGKELFAREIHRLSNRNNGPFITINCGAIPENLLESELFGHKKGAFTGAVADKLGKFKLADKGTLFLDELGELPLVLQVKLLRAIEEKKITPIGGGFPEDVDIRIVAATNRTLEDEVKEGRFREDLFYRLNVIQLVLPPLRERDDDLILLARYFLQKFSAEFERSFKGFTADAIISMKKYRWGGNIRELQNLIKKAVILSEGTHIGPEDLEFRGADMSEILPLAEAKDRFQARYINDILRLNGGNRTKTARDLGVDPRTIFRHLEKEQQK